MAIAAPQPMTELTPILRNIRIKNVTATSPKNAGYIVGLPESLVENVVLENVWISAPIGLTIRNAARQRAVRTGKCPGRKIRAK